MTTESTLFLSYFSKLRQVAAEQKYRYGVVLKGQQQWNIDVCNSWLSTMKDNTVFQLGGEPLSGTKHVPFKKGQQLLGLECELLICDFSEGWDANSFSAALGTVIGGGVVVIFGIASLPDNHADIWMNRALDDLICLSEDSSPSLPLIPKATVDIDFSQQQSAVANIIRVVEGHRKRPFVLTADRGRGKSSALGMAAAKLMLTRNINIVVTAPNLSAVFPVFQFAKQKLPDAEIKRGLVITEGSSLRFIAPDELLLERPNCDLLLVDEAAALPLPILEGLVNQYHRIVFSSTIHGYEGCGRGFTLKFQTWLQSARPGMNSQRITQPIRWNSGDPLEAWHRQCFLLDFEFEPFQLSIETSNLKYRKVSKDELIANYELSHHIFSLLVNAHYQTSPNDLFHLLSDPKMSVYVAIYSGKVVACILSVNEGELEPSLIEDIQLGKRRPKGHLVPVTIANQLGISAAAHQASVRIMRIAVHPDLQHSGIGGRFVDYFIKQQSCDYVSTSFGATSHLVHFWKKCGFNCIKIGSQRDQASGCYSIVMVKGEGIKWLDFAKKQFFTHLIYELPDSLKQIDIELLKVLLIKQQVPHSSVPYELLRQYSLGGSNYESVAVWLHKFLISLSSNHIDKVSNITIAKVLQRLSWAECAQKFDLAGRKSIEAKIRENICSILDDLHCKTTD